MRAETLERFAEAYRPCGFRPEAFNPCYGLAEATLVVSIGCQEAAPTVGAFESAALEQRRAVPAQDADGARRIVGCGSALPDQRTLIVDPETRQLCAPGQIGEIWVQGPSVAQGYWQRPEETRQTFQAYLADGVTGPFLRTGDLGFMQDGQLFLNGRLKDTLIIRGANHYPQDIEQTVERCHPALRPNGAAAFALEVDGEEQLAIVQELQRTALRSDFEEIYTAIRRAVAESHGLQAHLIVLVGPGGVPRTTSGKIQRSACRAAWLAGTLNVAGAWQQAADDGGEGAGKGAAGSGSAPAAAQEIAGWLARRLARYLRVAETEIRLDHTFAQYGLDSAASVEMTGDLQNWLGRKLAPTLFYEYPTIRLLAQYLAGHAETAPAPSGVGRQEPIAIVGMGCRFPGGANDPEAFWQLLADGVDAVALVPPDRWDQEAWYDADPARPGKTAARWGSFLERVDGFDADFFGITPREAQRMDPQQRLLLEVAWEALEDAGLRLEALRQGLTGVYVGAYNSDYFWMQLADPEGVDPYTSAGCAHSILANRLSYFLDLRGPSLTVDTACSSSLVAVHLACQGLRGGECRVAFAGAVNLILSPLSALVTGKTLTMAADGRCKAFDARADGIVRGEGCGVIVLKRLSDALADGDRVLAVIHGSAVNQDGRTNGLTAPNGLSQQAVIRQALAAAGIAPAQVGYVEAHGTGTPLGDPIEMGALQAVYGRADHDAAPCFVGSVKTNLGHLEAAAGLAGLIKTVLSLQRGLIPPHLHFQRWNPHIAVKESQFVVPRQCTPWPQGSHPRYAGVSSFGFGGTNAHLILGEPPAVQPAAPEAEEAGPYLLPLSAASAQALQQRAEEMHHYLLSATAGNDLRALCHTAGVRRNHLRHRVAVVGESKEALAAKLAAFAGRSAEREAPADGARPKVAFVFGGQGPQWAGMGLELMRRETVFRRILEECEAVYRAETGRSLLAEIAREEAQSRLNQTEIAQPALFAVQAALAGLLRHWGVEPDAVVGHSMGEVAAAYCAGVFSLPDAMRLIIRRAQVMAQSAGPGRMAAVGAGADEVMRLLGEREGVEIAALNSPDAATLSGEAAAVEAAVQALRERRVRCQFLPGHYAFHSEQMEALRQDLLAALSPLRPQSEAVPFYSTVTGQCLPGHCLDADYWFGNLRQTVRFAPAIQALIADGYRTFVEISPQPALTHYIQQGLEQPQIEGTALPGMRRGKEGHALLAAVADLYTQGQPIAWDRIYPAGRPISLPCYPFQRQRYWLPAPAASHSAPPSPAAYAANARPIQSAPPSPTQAVVRTASPPPPARPKPKSPAFALPTAPEERLAALEQYVRERVLQALGRAPSESLDPNVPLSSVGLDSLMVVELKSLVERELSVAVPTDLLLSGPSIAQVALWLRDQLAEGNLAGTPAGMPAKMPTGTLAVTSAPPAQAAVPLTPEAVAGLSDEEVDRLLKLMLKGKGTSK